MRFWIKEKHRYLTVTYEDLVKIQKIGQIEFMIIVKLMRNMTLLRKQFFSRTASKNQVTKDVHTRSIGKSSFENKKDDFLKSLENQRFFWNKK